MRCNPARGNARIIEIRRPDRKGLKSLFFPIKHHLKLWVDMAVAAILGIIVGLGIYSIYHTTNSIFFWPLFPGGIVGMLLSGGPHDGSELIGVPIMWFVDVGLYWSVWKLLSWAFAKLAGPRSST